MLVIQLLAAVPETDLPGVKESLAMHMEDYGKLAVPEIAQDGDGCFRIMLQAKVDTKQALPLRRAVEGYAAKNPDIQIASIQEYVATRKKPLFEECADAGEQLNFTPRRT